MNPSKLKALHQSTASGSFFFSRKTMKFFGDTMANYAVSKKTVYVRKNDGMVLPYHRFS